MAKFDTELYAKMPFLEDSGIESEDKSSVPAHERESRCNPKNDTTEHMDDLKVTFSSQTSMEQDPSSSSPVIASTNLENSAKAPNTCRILQRKLELKVERAKRNYNQYQETKKTKSQSAALIPIGRLSIPGELEQKPLVDYKSESDDCEEISFFPDLQFKARTKKRAELTDTFSIQEMTIDSDVESTDSQNLEFLTPRMKKNCLDYFATCLCFQSLS